MGGVTLFAGSPHRESAVDNEFGPGHPTGPIAREEETTIGDVDGLTEAAHRGRRQAGDGADGIFVDVPFMPVVTMPGWTEFTRMLSGAYCSAADFVARRTEPLEA